MEELKKKAKSKAEDIIYPLAKKLGITEKQLSHEDIEVEFIFFKNGGLKESLSKQLRYGGNYADFAKTMINLDRVLDSAVLIEVHRDKYEGTPRANENLEAVYVLFGAFQDGNNIIPVQMEIKKSSDVGGRLYMTVALTKIEADVLGSTPEKIQTRSLIPASAYILADIVHEINPEDAHFLKYLPDGMLTSKQIEAKKQALAEDAERIEKYREDSRYSVSAKEDLAPVRKDLKPVRGEIYGSNVELAPVRKDLALEQEEALEQKRKELDEKIIQERQRLGEEFDREAERLAELTKSQDVFRRKMAKDLYTELQNRYFR